MVDRILNIPGFCIWWWRWMMNGFCGMVDQQKVFCLISSWYHCKRSLPLQMSDTLQAGFGLAQDLSPGFVALSWILCNNENYYLVLIMPSEYVSGFEYTRVLKMPGFHRILNMPEHSWIILENAWLYLNITECA